MSPLMIALLVFSAFVTAVLGQATHTVVMGVAGSVPDPPVVVARQGDVVTFVFANGIHGITQSSFDTPCLPLPGGFNSGLVSAINTTTPVQSWNLHIEDASTPIWYFCPSTRPLSHCAGGMVGVINPTNLSAYDSYASAAKAVTGTPTPSPAFTATGVGAYATGPPSAILATTPPPLAPPASTQTSSTAATSAAGVATSRSSNTGIIVGGIIGGFLALVFVVLLAWLFRRFVQRHVGTTPGPRPFYAPSSEAPFAPLLSQRQSMLGDTHLVPMRPVLRPADNSARDGDVPAGNDDVTRQLSEIKEEISRLRITLRRKHRRVPVPDA